MCTNRTRGDVEHTPTGMKYHGRRNSSITVQAHEPSDSAIGRMMGIVRKLAGGARAKYVWCVGDICRMVADNVQSVTDDTNPGPTGRCCQLAEAWTAILRQPSAIPHTPYMNAPRRNRRCTRYSI